MGNDALEDKTNKENRSTMVEPIEWNFEKFFIDRRGQFIGH